MKKVCVLVLLLVLLLWPAGCNDLDVLENTANDAQSNNESESEAEVSDKPGSSSPEAIAQYFGLSLNILQPTGVADIRCRVSSKYDLIFWLDDAPSDIRSDHQAYWQQVFTGMAGASDSGTVYELGSWMLSSPKVLSEPAESKVSFMGSYQRDGRWVDVTVTYTVGYSNTDPVEHDQLSAYIVSLDDDGAHAPDTGWGP